MTYKKKLIEVALPLEAINIASARKTWQSWCYTCAENADHPHF